MEDKPEEKSEKNSEIKAEANPNPQPPKPEETKKRFVSINDLTQKESKINTIFSKFKKKLEETKPGLFLRPHNCEYKSSEFQHLFQYEKSFPLKIKQEFSFIYDSLNFICYQPKDEEEVQNTEKYVQKFKELFSYLKQNFLLIFISSTFVLFYF